MPLGEWVQLPEAQMVLLVSLPLGGLQVFPQLQEQGLSVRRVAALELLPSAQPALRLASPAQSVSPRQA